MLGRAGQSTFIVVGQALAQIRAESNIMTALVRSAFDQINIMHGSGFAKTRPCYAEASQGILRRELPVRNRGLDPMPGGAVPSEAPQGRRMAEGGGFEPPVGCPTSAFQAGTLNHSA